MPKIFDIIENIAKNPSFDKDKLIDLIKKEIKETFIVKWEENKCLFLIYLLMTIMCFEIDFILYITQLIISIKIIGY